MEVKRSENCWDYVSGNLRRSYPVLDVLIIVDGIANQFLFELDTGYDGSLLLPLHVFYELRLNEFEIPRKYWATAETVTGKKIILRTAIAEVQVGSLRFETEIETYEGNNLFLAGLGLIDEVKILLNGVEKRLCIIENT